MSVLKEMKVDKETKILCIYLFELKQIIDYLAVFRPYLKSIDQDYWKYKHLDFQLRTYIYRANILVVSINDLINKSFKEKRKRFRFKFSKEVKEYIKTAKNHRNGALAHLDVEYLLDKEGNYKRNKIVVIPGLKKIWQEFEEFYFKITDYGVDVPPDNHFKEHLKKTFSF